LNLLFISPSNAIGGAERSLYEMVRYLHSQGHQVFVALPPSDDPSFTTLLRPFVAGCLYLPFMPLNLLRNLSVTAVLKGWFKRIIRSRGAWLYSVPRLVQFIKNQQIELVYTNTMLVLDGAIAARLCGIPHVQHVREITGYGKGALYALPLQTRPLRFKNWAGKLHRSVIANSEYVATEQAAYFPMEKTAVLYNMVEVPKQSPRDRLFPNTLGMVANVTSKVKNHLFFVKVAALLAPRFPDLKFVVYGKLPPADDPYLQTLHTAIQQYSLQERWEFKGVCQDPLPMYASIGVLLHPYPFETFGRIYLEAMSHGVPIVAAAGGGALELVRHNQTGLLFDENNVEQAAAQVEFLWNTPETCARLSRAGMAFVATFRPETIGPTLSALLSSASSARS
jgi:glycosyltransferase involved in cell wall biosynthesis